MRSPERGLTMLEVLGAAALLAFAYIALTRSEIEGLRAEQESNRRLQASLLADERLADLELELAAGTAPALGEREEEPEAEVPFRVRTSVRAFEPPPPPKDAKLGGPRDGSLAARHAERTLDPNAPSLFAPPKLGETDPPLRTIEVVVLWDEGVYEREVRRTTFALDPVAAEALLAEAQASAAGGDKAPKDEDAAEKPGEKPGESPGEMPPELEAPQRTAPDGGRRSEIEE